MKKNTISAPTISEILYEEFMEPVGITAKKLAEDIHIPISEIQGILNGDKRVSVDISLRLARYFGVSERYFLDIQSDIDVRNAKLSMPDEFFRIPFFRTKMAL